MKQTKQQAAAAILAAPLKKLTRSEQNLLKTLGYKTRQNYKGRNAYGLIKDGRRLDLASDLEWQSLRLRLERIVREG